METKHCKNVYLTSIARSLSHKTGKASNGDYDEFWIRLADRLMLDEILAGEANPTEFLKNEIYELCNEIKLEDLNYQRDKLINRGHHQ